MSEVQYTEGITITAAMAAYLVDVIGLLEQLLAHRNGQPLPAKLRGVRGDFKECLSRAAARADAIVDAAAPPAVVASEEMMMDTRAAADMLGISAGAVALACRKGKLGTKIGDRWLISEKEVAMYRNTQEVA